MTEVLKTQLVQGRDTYEAAFEQVGRAAALPDFASGLRDRAFARFSDLGFPTTKLERWRFTNVTPIAKTPFILAPPAEVQGSTLAPYELPTVSGLRLVFVNGRYVQDLSVLSELPAGISIRSLAETLATDPGVVEADLGGLAAFDNDAFTAMNTALLSDGAVVRVEPNTSIETPLHLLFLSTDDDDGKSLMTHPRVLVHAGENSQLRVIETYAGPDDARYFTNAVTEIVAGPNAVVDHYKLLRDGLQAFHVASMHLRLARSARFSSHSITIGGGFVRNDVDAVLDGEGVECTLNGLYLTNGRRFVDNHTTIHHAKPHCASHELYKGILDDEAHAVFNGKIIVELDAQKTDAKQTNSALLLSEGSQINTKPELEIFADDVKCTHGATIGQLDEEALFYLRSRGLSRHQARDVLIHAFASDLLNRIAIKPIRDTLDEILQQQLPGSGGGTVHE